jgi:hypothetical protein
MKKILTIATIAIFAVNFANASNVKGGKVNTSAKVKTTHIKYVKLSAKDFSVKNMQDTKDMLMQSGSTNAYASR